MSEVKGISTITNRAGTGAVDFSNGVNISGSDSGLTGFKHTEGATEPTSPSNGDTWWDTENEVYQIYVNDTWTTYIGASSSAVWYGDRAILAGGTSASRINVIQYWDMTSAGNATDFGDLNISVTQPSGVSDATLGVFGGGFDGTRSNVIDYITISTTGNASDFGDLTVGRNGLGGVSDATYGVFAGGYGTVSTTTWQDIIDYVTIQTTGNAADFGDLTVVRATLASISNTTYGLFAGGSNINGAQNTIDYITVATTGNASDFGDLLVITKDLSNGGADDTRGIIAGGQVPPVNTIQYVTISTPSNATDFGDLLTNANFAACTSNGTYVHICGGDDGSLKLNTIQQITVQTTGNSSDFGDLTATQNASAGISGAAS